MAWVHPLHATLGGVQGLEEAWDQEALHLQQQCRCSF